MVVASLCVKCAFKIIAKSLPLYEASNAKRSADINNSTHSALALTQLKNSANLWPPASALLLSWLAAPASSSSSLLVPPAPNLHHKAWFVGAGSSTNCSISLSLSLSRSQTHGSSESRATPDCDRYAASSQIRDPSAQAAALEASRRFQCYNFTDSLTSCWLARSLATA